jgi:hypothetical protein
LGFEQQVQMRALDREVHDAHAEAFPGGAQRAEDDLRLPVRAEVADTGAYT